MGVFHILNRTNGTKSRKTSNYIADRDKLLFCEDGEDKLVNKLFFLSCCLAVPQQILSPHRGECLNNSMFITISYSILNWAQA